MASVGITVMPICRSLVCFCTHMLCLTRNGIELHEYTLHTYRYVM